MVSFSSLSLISLLSENYPYVITLAKWNNHSIKLAIRDKLSLGIVLSFGGLLLGTVIMIVSDIGYFMASKTRGRERLARQFKASYEFGYRMAAISALVCAIFFLIHDLGK
jgi:hypothetical protein